jgi:protocatechuate 3,4-dioxygenase beta subunit
MRRILLTVAACLSLAAHAGDCRPTPGRTLCTHYDLSKATHQPGDLGRGLVMHGRVLAAPDCAPVPGIKIVHWQAGAEGRYIDRLYAWRLTDQNGAYRFETEWPALFPPHIHFLVEAPGYAPLATQWIGDGRVSTVQFDLVLRPVD